MYDCDLCAVIAEQIMMEGGDSTREIGMDVEDKIIEEYLKFIKRLKKGYKDDYSHILDMICFL